MDSETGGEENPNSHIIALNSSDFKKGMPFTSIVAAFHETVHEMWYGEYGAWSACVAVGYVSDDKMISNLSSNNKEKLEYYLGKTNPFVGDLLNKKITPGQVVENMKQLGNIINKY